MVSHRYHRRVFKSTFTSDFTVSKLYLIVITITKALSHQLPESKLMVQIKKMDLLFLLVFAPKDHHPSIVMIIRIAMHMTYGGVRFGFLVTYLHLHT